MSLFVDAVPALMGTAQQMGADRVELYTEPHAAAPASTVSECLARYRAAAAAARAAGLGVNAGHDLNLANLPAFVSWVAPDEVSIGHALVANALMLGMAESVRRYRLASETPVTSSTSG